MKLDPKAMKGRNTSTESDANPGTCGNCGGQLIRSGGTVTHTNRSVLCPD